jgi:hypothetical protein
MELWNRSITAVTFMLAALVLAAFGVTAFMSRYPSKSPNVRQASMNPSFPSTSRLPQQTSDAIALRSLELARARDRIAELETRLREEHQQLVTLRTAVERLQTHSSNLEAERDASIDWANTLITKETPPTTAAAAEEPNAATPANPETPNEQGQLEVEELRAQVAEMRGLLDEVEASAENEATQLRTELTRLQQLTADLLSETGSAAVPALSEMLESREPRERLWAARMLKAIGPDADNAMAALMLALSDPDAEVRAAAQEAINAIHE